MRIFLAAAVVGSALTGCDYTPSPSQVAENTQVGATGGIRYTFEELTDSKKLLAITAAPGIGETEGSIQQRMYQFAVRFAAKDCPNQFTFINDPNMSQALAGGFMRRTRSYVFECS